MKILSLPLVVLKINLFLQSEKIQRVIIQVNI
jgi:hypothetical protein